MMAVSIPSTARATPAPSKTQWYRIAGRFCIVSCCILLYYLLSLRSSDSSVPSIEPAPASELSNPVVSAPARSEPATLPAIRRPRWTVAEEALGGGTAVPPPTFDTPFDLGAPQPTPPPFLPPAVASAAREFAKDPHTPTLLALMADLVRRRLHVLDALTSGGKGAGVFVRDGASLMRNFEHAVASTHRDCRREAVLPVTCLLTSGEAAFLQEWMAWHMVQGWAHVYAMVDLPLGDPRWADTLAALGPFVEAGFVTPVRAARREGGDEQNRLLNACLEAVRGGGCGIAKRFGSSGSSSSQRPPQSPDDAGADGLPPHAEDAAASPEGGEGPSAAATAASPSPPPLSQWASHDPASLPTTDAPFFGAEPCAAGDRSWQSAVWVTAHDDDELPFIRGSPQTRAPPADAGHLRSDCLTDWLGAYVQHGAVHMQWVAYGGHALAVHPPAGLVSELYTQRSATAEATHKVAVNLPQVMRLHKGHEAQLDEHHKRQGVDEWGRKPAQPVSARRPVAITAASPRLVLAHFFGRSVERTLLKWVKGRPSKAAVDGWPGMRSPAEVVVKQLAMGDAEGGGSPPAPPLVSEALPGAVVREVRLTLGLPETPPPQPSPQPPAAAAGRRTHGRGRGALSKRERAAAAAAGAGEKF